MLGGFPGGSDSKESACNDGDMVLISESERFPWRREWLPNPVLLPGEFHGQRSLVSYSPWSHKESDMTEWPFIRYLLFLISAENLGVLAVSDGIVCGMPCSCRSVSMGDWSRTPVDSKIWGCSYLYNGIVQATIYIHRFWIHGFSQPWIAPQMGNGCLYR